MEWAKPNYSRREVNRAGNTLINPFASAEDLENAYVVINNWRASHNFPLNTFQIRLRDKAAQVDKNSLVAQRIKRLSSIKSKLERINGINLAQIQDIGGCRAIVSNIQSVNELVRIYKSQQSRGLKHALFSFDDYVFEKPKIDGYRSVHLVYHYKSDKNILYQNLKIEIQIRTLLQHAWATTVETIDTFTEQTLKIGGGNERWKRTNKFANYNYNAFICGNKKPLLLKG
jgi:ppGpp synthetase/RelA/SpoT-type nucleotidyltranferase